MSQDEILIVMPEARRDVAWAEADAKTPARLWGGPAGNP
jgi:hypothetical protein